MNAADRNLLRILLPPLLGLGLVAALNYPLDRDPADGTKPPSAVAPRHVHAPLGTASP